MKRHPFVCVLILCVCAIAIGLSFAEARAESREECDHAFTTGNDLLTQSDLNGALRSYAEAVKCDPQKKGYQQQYAFLRRIISMREKLPGEANLQKWESMARGLHAFYLDYGVFGEAVSVCRELHARFESAETTIMLAEAQVELGLNEEATTLLSAMFANGMPTYGRVLGGIAWARQGQMDAARAIAGEVEPRPDFDNIEYYQLARLHALVGDHNRASSLLIKSLESTPPSGLALFKARVMSSDDLQVLMTGPDSVQLLAVKSKIKESSCSTGKDCSGCALAGSCSKASPK